jgi:hypothetical protein
VHRRAGSCTPVSDYMRHRVRRSWREWEKIGASVRTLQWIREGLSIQFKDNRPPPNSTKGCHYEVTKLQTLPRLLIFKSELPRPSPAQYRLDRQQFRHSPAVPRPVALLSRTHQLAALTSLYSRLDMPLPRRHYLPESHLRRSTCWTMCALPVEFNASHALALRNTHHGSCHRRRRPPHPYGLHRRIPPSQHRPPIHCGSPVATPAQPSRGRGSPSRDYQIGKG